MPLLKCTGKPILSISKLSYNSFKKIHIKEDNLNLEWSNFLFDISQCHISRTKEMLSAPSQTHCAKQMHDLCDHSLEILEMPLKLSQQSSNKSDQARNIYHYQMLDISTQYMWPQTRNKIEGTISTKLSWSEHSCILIQESNTDTVDQNLKKNITNSLVESVLPFEGATRKVSVDASFAVIRGLHFRSNQDKPKLKTASATAHSI